MRSEYLVRLQMLTLAEQMKIKIAYRWGKGIGISGENHAAISKRRLDLVGAGGGRKPRLASSFKNTVGMNLDQWKFFSILKNQGDGCRAGIKDPGNTATRSVGANPQNVVRVAMSTFDQWIEILGTECNGGGERLVRKGSFARGDIHSLSYCSET